MHCTIAVCLIMRIDVNKVKVFSGIYELYLN